MQAVPLIYTRGDAIPFIIVSYRNPGEVIGCLRTLQRSAASPSFDVYLCENGGVEALDGLLAALSDPHAACENSTARSLGNVPTPPFRRLHSLRRRGRNTRVFVALAAHNFGYAGPISALLSVPWIGAWILNPATEPGSLALAELVARSEAPRCGMVGSRIVALSDHETVHTQGLQWRSVQATTRAVDHLAVAAIEPDPEQLEGRLDAPSGASMYVTRNCLESIGLIDERYFLYFEELDWGPCAKRSEKIGYAHNSVVRHRGGQRSARRQGTQ
jgi:N-acetylglucosaminyl-diphospho-decaprenol L-rhamnosyltransferase